MQSDRQTPRQQSNRPISHAKPSGRKIRYDRILAVIVIFVLLIVILVKCCSSCSSKKGSATTPATTEAATDATEAATEAAQDYSNTVYLSPSNQSDNTFYVGDTNEAEVCRILAEKTAAILQQSGVEVIVAGADDDIQTKTAMGDNGLAAYVAIHTNQGTGVGTDCYYNSSSEESQALAQAVYDPVAELTPTADRGLLDGSQSGSDSYQYEIGNNQSPSCLVEVEFHDGPNVAQWILDNEDNIATAIATGICNYLQVTTVGGSSDAASTTADGTAADGTAETTTANAIQDQLSAGD